MNSGEVRAPGTARPAEGGRDHHAGARRAPRRAHGRALSRGDHRCAESLEAIRNAKARKLPVTSGVSINHLTLNENDIGPYRTFSR